jgi:hypothetical protein
MSNATQWLLLIASLPTRPAAARMRLWRGVKALGCAALRDGAYLMPDVAASTELARLAREVNEAGGTAEIVRIAATNDAQAGRFRALFDRSADYGRLLGAIAAANADEKTVRALRRDYASIAAGDFFPGEAQQQALAALTTLEAAVSGEPATRAGAVERLDRKDYQGRVWATRRHLWIDRMASAWLIRRCIDRKAKFVWLTNPKRCPKDALGFDFDGAAFTHVGNRVSFEVLAASFGLDADPVIARIGALVHALDVGGVPVAEAAGIEAILAGARERCSDDDALLAEACRIFDALHTAFLKENSHD